MHNSKVDESEKITSFHKFYTQMEFLNCLKPVSSSELPVNGNQEFWGRSSGSTINQ